MTGQEIDIYAKARPDRSVSIAERHAQVMAGLSQIEPPLGFRGGTPPPAPEWQPGDPIVQYIARTMRGVSVHGVYNYRGERCVYEDRASFDESISYSFKTSNQLVDYGAMLHTLLPQVIEAFGPYRVFVSFGYHALAYTSGSPDGQLRSDGDGYPVEVNPIYNRLRTAPDIDVDGRGNIYTLHPAVYWDEELCRRALGYGHEEVVRRLAGHVVRVEAIRDGVYLVLNDDAALGYADFVAMNARIKSILGLA